MNYVGKQVLVLGLGESGLAMALWLARCGAMVRVADTRAAPERLPQLLAAVPAAEFRSGDFNAELLAQIDIIAVSPGLLPMRDLAAILPTASAQNIPVWSEIELFAQALASLRIDQAYAPKVIAITGTNGKTTVTRLTGLLCERAGMTVQVAGNISPSALDVLRDALDQNALPQVWVLELSSFQLHATHTLQADVATVLNITQDHLDWHGDMAAYIADKARIFGANTVYVLNRDDAATMQMASPLAPMVSFGAGIPDAPDCFGLQTDNGMQWLALAQAVDGSETKRSRKAAATPVEIFLTRLMPVDALKIRGQHNAVNALAALALCRAIGLPLAPLLHGLREYEGEPHRVELIATIKQVTYVDDSKGTNVGATVAALNGLGLQQGTSAKLILIAGGEGKGQDFTPLLQPVQRFVRAVILIGADAAALRAALAESQIELIDCASLPLAVERAATLARAGDTVLLSPACASFDMFRNYAHRAEVFIDTVREIGAAQGEVII